MIILDANVLIELSTGDENNERVERILELIDGCVKAKTVIGIPAPAWTEFLCGTSLAQDSLLSVLQKKSAVRILPFDESAAIEAAFIHKSKSKHGKKKQTSAAPWQKIKIDRQILAIAKVHSVTAIYTDDKELIKEANAAGVAAFNVMDIPLKPKQNNLKLDVPTTPSDDSF